MFPSWGCHRTPWAKKKKKKKKKKTTYKLYCNTITIGATALWAWPLIIRKHTISIGATALWAWPLKRSNRKLNRHIHITNCPPPPGSRVSRHNSSTGEGGRAPWRPVSDRDQGGIQGGSGVTDSHGGSGVSGIHGESGVSGSHGGSGSVALKKKMYWGDFEI